MKGENDTCLKEFAQYTTLNILGMIGMSCYILADTFFISKGMGANGLTALNLAIPVYSMIHGSGLMLGMGGATKYSIFKGQGSGRNAGKVFSNTLYMAAMLIVVYMLMGVFLSGKITALLGADAEVFGMTEIYLKVILLFAPAFIMNNVFICFVRNDGNPRLAMLAMLIGSLSNIIFDYIFIFPFHMGIFGAVLATGVSPVVSMLILSRHWKRREHFHAEKTRPQGKLMGGILALGVPSLISEVASGIVILVFNMIILRILGNIGVAAYGVVANISLVVISIYTGIAQGMQPLTSSAYGSNDRETIRKTLRYAVCTAFVMSVLVYIVVFLLADPITAVFNSERNTQLQEIAVQGLKVYFLAVPFAGFNIVMSMFFASTEKAVPAQIITLMRGLVLIVPMAFLMSAAAGIIGVWMTFPVTEAIVAVMGAALYWKMGKSGLGA